MPFTLLFYFQQRTRCLALKDMLLCCAHRRGYPLSYRGTRNATFLFILAFEITKWVSYVYPRFGPC